MAEKNKVISETCLQSTIKVLDHFFGLRVGSRIHQIIKPTICHRGLAGNTLV